MTLKKVKPVACSYYEDEVPVNSPFNCYNCYKSRTIKSAESHNYNTNII